MAPIPRRIDYLMSLAERSTSLPLRHLKHWRPISIDALGLVTLLGADDVNKSIGTLQRRRFTECLPLLAAFVIAGDNFTDEQPGYALYNITDGIYTTELKGWFTRWLSAQRINNSTTVFHWNVESKSAKFRGFQYVAAAIAFFAVAPLLVCTCLIGDWYGVGNSVAIIFSVLVRQCLLWQLREGLNKAAVVPTTKPDGSGNLPLHYVNSEKSQGSGSTLTKQLHRQTSAPHSTDKVTIFVTRADGKMVTIYAQRPILSTFTKTITLQSPEWYHFLRWVGWAAFGAHIIVLGMSSLFTQIYTVVLLVFSTWALCHDFDFDTGRDYSGVQCKDGISAQRIRIPFTSRVTVEQENPKTPKESKLPENNEMPDRRMLAYVRAEPNQKQVEMLQHWSMMPFKGVLWYEEYEAAKAVHSQRMNPVQPQDSTQSIDSSRSPTLSGDP